ncbi:uncharacterized protein LOC126898994 isoform X2 [Daktulosphaira vitifoliae]|uniref:uncharacterized protein LOC126898994 isoform X2 n=1 Tax=Daktulosphaira vitifoliae TaxID=58002 RepID=UPI0021A9C49B|nr:uncharacterized protein LOC126898994 isoform X2 [Daktulosphaira vitifoliae]
MHSNIFLILMLSCFMSTLALNIIAKLFDKLKGTQQTLEDEYIELTGDLSNNITNEDLKIYFNLKNQGWSILNDYDIQLLKEYFKYGNEHYLRIIMIIKLRNDVMFLDEKSLDFDFFSTIVKLKKRTYEDSEKLIENIYNENNGRINKYQSSIIHALLGLTVHPSTIDRIFELSNVDENGYITKDDFINAFKQMA